jgi:DUF4097 and DUF4098 domain-containing protein YvlB
MRARTSILVTTAVLLAALPALAQQHVDETKTASAEGVVTISTVSGSIRVTGWSDAKVHVSGTLGRGIERLDFDVSGRNTTIKVVYPEHCRKCEGADLVIELPAGSQVRVNTVSAPIEVDRVTGELDLQSVSGDVDVRGRPSEVHAESVSGDLGLAAGTAPVVAKSVSGDVTVTEAGDSLRASTVSGELSVDVQRLDRCELSSVSGTVTIAGDLAPGGRVEAGTVSGGIALTLPAGVAADFHAETFSGSISNDLGPQAQRTGEYTPQKELTFSTGNGGARVELKTFSGNVKIRKK